MLQFSIISFQTVFLVFSFLNELELICMHTSMAIVSTQDNSFNYYFLGLIILFDVYPVLANYAGFTSIAL